MNEVLDFLNVDELTVKFTRAKNMDDFSVTTYVEFDDYKIPHFGVNVQASIMNYLERLPNITDKNYIQFITRSKFREYFISFLDLKNLNIGIIDSPVFVYNNQQFMTQTYLYNGVNDIVLSDFGFIYSFEEQSYGVKIRGVKKADQ